jgi:hypothetical protein
MVENCAFFCLSFQNEERKCAMEQRFTRLGIQDRVAFYDGVQHDDDRLINAGNAKRIWSYTYGHLDMIRQFYEDTDKEYGIFCEDDIFIRKDFLTFLPQIVDDAREMKLDIILLGYLTNYVIQAFPGFEEKMDNHVENYPFKYYNYPEHIWGAQMYMIPREHAKFLLEKYAPPYAEKSLTDTSLRCFNSDNCITKEGHRSILYPMIAIEDGKTDYVDRGQNDFHKSCFALNYVEGLFHE